MKGQLHTARGKPKHMTTLPATKEDGVNAFLNSHGGPVGEFIKFSKDAKFERVSDGEEVPVGTKLICVFPETQHGWVKFNGTGQPPTRHMGPMFGGYVPPARTELGDDDASLWERGLSGKPQDPWRAQVLLPLKQADGDRLYVFQTSSTTGLRAVASLVSECKQMAKREPDVYPVIELAVGAFEHKEPRVGTVKKPAFKIVGKVSRSGVEPPQIGAAAVLNDEIPW
jgi:hypothetical protein